MRRQHAWLICICFIVLGFVGLQSSPVKRLTGPNYVRAASSAPDDDFVILLPLTQNQAAPSLPTIEPSPTPSSTPSASPSPLPTLSPTPSSTPDALPIVADIFVDDTNTSGVEDGSPEHPFANLQAAIDMISNSEPLTIAVAAGIYTENIRVENKVVHLYGGFAGGTLADYTNGVGGKFAERDISANVTHIEGDRTDAVVALIEAGDTTIDGFRITNGSRSLIPEYGELGGGIFVRGGTPIISHNLIENNDARPIGSESVETIGGGIYADAANISILNNTIRNNTAGRGGGIAVSGGEIVIRGNQVLNNIGVSDHGGGLYIVSPNAQISHNLISGNRIGEVVGYGWGGGIVVFGDPNTPGSSFAHLSFNIFTQNYAPGVGGGIFVDDGARAIIEHELIYNNICPGEDSAGGGVGIYVDGYNDVGSYVTIVNSTIAGHNCDATKLGNGIYVEANSGVTIRNSIFWGNNGDDYVIIDENSKITATYTLSEEPLPGLGNISTDPLFTDPVNHDYHLQSTNGRWNPSANGGAGDWVEDQSDSPAIDAGDPSSPFKNESTPNGGRVNLGAYGNTIEASKSSQ